METSSKILPSTTEELISWFESNFECFFGKPRAFFEIQLGPEFSYDGKANAVFRGVYQTHAIKTRDMANAEKNLVAAMFWDFAPFAGKDHALFWRLPEKIIFKEVVVQEFGKLVAVKEVIEDGRLQIRSGWVEDFDSGHWYEDSGTSKEWVLRTRLCLPAASWVIAPPMSTMKPEGALTRTLKEAPSKSSFPPGGHHNGAMQTTEEEAEYNRIADKRFKALCESMKQSRKEALKDFAVKMSKMEW